MVLLLWKKKKKKDAQIPMFVCTKNTPGRMIQALLTEAALETPFPWCLFSLHIDCISINILTIKEAGLPAPAECEH